MANWIDVAINSPIICSSKGSNQKNVVAFTRNEVRFLLLLCLVFSKQERPSWDSRSRLSRLPFDLVFADRATARMAALSGAGEMAEELIECPDDARFVLPTHDSKSPDIYGSDPLKDYRPSIPTYRSRRMIPLCCSLRPARLEAEREF
jgi:hypothetical protein